MRRIGGCIGIHFKNSDTVRVVLLINGVQHKNPWLYANRSLYALGDGRFEGLQLRGIDVKFCQAHVLHLRLAAEGEG